MKLLSRLVVICLSLVLVSPPAYSLAPKPQPIVAQGPFQLDSQNFEIVRVDLKNDKILHFRSRHTGDIWFLEFTHSFKKAPQPIWLAYHLPSPIAIGLRMFQNPGEKSFPLPLPVKIRSEKLTAWIVLDQPVSRFDSVLWKALLWEQAYFNQLYEIGDKEIRQSFLDLLGEKELFQVEDGSYLEGNGIWGLPVLNRLRRNEKPRDYSNTNGRRADKEILIYDHKPTQSEFSRGNLPLTDQIGRFIKGNLVVKKMRSFSFLQAEISVLQEKVSVLNGTKSPEINRQRRKLLRELNGLLAIRNRLYDKIEEMDKVKRELQLLMDQPHWHDREYFESRGSERRSGKDRRLRDEPKPEKHSRSSKPRRGVDQKRKQLLSDIRITQNWLSKYLFNTIEEEMADLGRSLRELEKRKKEAFVVRSVLGDEVGYEIVGNESSLYPPIVVYTGWNGQSEDSFLTLLRSGETKAEQLLETFRFIVVTYPGYSYQINGEKYSLHKSSESKPENFFERLASTFNAILNAEGDDKAYVLGSGVGAAIAGEVSRAYYKQRMTPGGRVIEFPIHGTILFDPVMFNPAKGADIDVRDFVPLIVKGFWPKKKLGWLVDNMFTRLGTDLVNATLTHSLIRKGLLSARVVRRAMTTHLFRFIKEGLSQEEIVARFEILQAFLTTRVKQTYDRAEALRRVETFVLARNSIEGRAIRRYVANAKNRTYDPDLTGLTLDLLFFSLMRKIEKDHDPSLLGLDPQGLNGVRAAL